MKRFTFLAQPVKNLYHRLNAISFTVLNGYPAKHLTVIGITGTDGKTTTASMIYRILETAGLKTALISTVGAFIGNQAIDTGFHVTSPDPKALQSLIRQFKQQGITHLVLEATSHGLDQHRLTGTNIRYAVVTNVTHEHLDYHRTFARYLKTKAKLFNQAKVVILNANDPGCQALKAFVKPKMRLITYTYYKDSHFPQLYNQANAAAAAALARELKIRKAIIVKALSSFKNVPGRMQTIPNHLGLQLIVDFAHTPNALEKVLTALKPKTGNKLIAVFGAAGERDASKRPLMGEIGARLANEVVLTSEDPRSENIYSILRQMLDGIKTNHGHVHTITDRQEAINFAINNLAKKGDTVAILGKGHEQAINLDGRHETPWSDEAGVKKAISN